VAGKTKDLSPPIDVTLKSISTKYNLDALRKKKRETDEDVENASFESQKPYKNGKDENF
jgi:hypothetical protein